MSWAFCTSGAAIAKAGINVNSSIVASGGALANWSDEIESMICDEARVDLITNFASLTESGKQVLQSISASYIGQQIIGYDPEAIGKSGATVRVNFLENNIRRGLAQIKDDKVKTYLGAT